jgi:hypothetical protein
VEGYGPVPKKYSEKIWKRFRKACDTFFTRKSEYFAGRDTSYEDNLKAKLAIIEELEAFDPGEDMKAGFREAQGYPEKVDRDRICSLQQEGGDSPQIQGGPQQASLTN